MLAVYRPHGFFGRIPTGDIAAVPSRQQPDKGEVSYPAALLSEIVRQTRPLRLRSSAPLPRFESYRPVIPGRREAASPESITTGRDYVSGFAASFARAPE